ncbi:type II toxin-antitoxin system RelE/ParE family toxin [Jonesia quinghaiensis]|uniref:type II toxin-antitoxin system RelE/ParE family toxin n=1 Tax=Jonesia quinghaiensis TaxID=262806 RepID=UPI00055E9C88|nr:type II toxin-antitoxin system RelE/ParE family toxin [Jonesia quinghaiensis]
MWTVDIELIAPWLGSLDKGSQAQVIAAIELLQEHGPHLGRPIVDSVAHSTYKNMKELRPGSTGRSELRVLFAFDPRRSAIMLVAGDRAGNWSSWNKKNIPVADELLNRRLRTLEGE